MNIAFLLKKFGGDEVDAAISTVLNLALALEKKGNNIYIITERGYIKNKKTQEWKRTKKHEIIKGLNVYRPYAFPQIRSKSFLNIPYLLERGVGPSLGIRYVEKNLGIKFDIVHSFGGAYISVLTGYFGKLLSKNKNIKFIHSIRAYSLYDKSWFSPGSLFWAKFLNLADYVLIPTNTMKSKLINSGVFKKKLKIVHSHIKIKNFYPIDKILMKKKYGFHGKKVILYYGQWGKQKGIHDLVKISPELVKEIDNITLLLISPNKLKPENQKIYDKYKLIGNLHLIEAVVDIKEYINLADVVVLPYKTIKGTETNPLCIIESICCKTPVVSTNFSDINDIFKNNFEIILAKPNNSSSLKEKLKLILSDQKLVEKVIENAYLKKDNFDIENIVEQYIKIYSN